MMKKFKVLTSFVLASTLGCASVSYAFDGYFPPERISCTAVAGKVSCEGFDPAILEVLQYSSHIDNHVTKTFNFTEGAAYYMTEDRTGIAFNYKDKQGKLVKLTAVDESARPDFSNSRSAWTKIQEGLFICNAGYMSCPITSVRLK